MRDFELNSQYSALSSAIQLIIDAAADHVSPSSPNLDRANDALPYILNLILSQGKPLAALQPMLLEAFQTSICLLPRVAYFGLTPSNRLRTLRGSEILGIAAAVNALVLQCDGTAVEFLEDTRSMFWSLALQLRTPLDKLPQEDAKQLTQLFNELEAGAHQSTLSSVPGWLDSKAVGLSQMSEQALSLLDTIQKCPGFHWFLLSEPFSDLAYAAARNPIVVLIAHEHLCEALVILNEAGETKRIPLAKLSISGLKHLGARIQATNLRMCTALEQSSYSQEAFLQGPNDFKVQQTFCPLCFVLSTVTGGGSRCGE